MLNLKNFTASKSSSVTKMKVYDKTEHFLHKLCFTTQVKPNNFIIFYLKTIFLFIIRYNIVQFVNTICMHYKLTITLFL